MFNINEFKSRMNKYGGLARTSLFVVRFSSRNIPNIIPADDLRFFCQTITMPGINIDTMPYKVSGLGYHEDMPMSSTPDPMNAVFLMDNNHKILSFFHNWINSVVNVSGENGPNTAQLERKEINYKENYVTSMDIDLFSYDNQNSFYRCTYDGVYPTQVSSVNLNWGDTEAAATLSVNFSYSRMIYSGFKNVSFEESRHFNPIEFSIPYGNNIRQIIQEFDQNKIEDGISSL